jgi:small subunit ribosomal protein S6
VKSGQAAPPEVSPPRLRVAPCPAVTSGRARDRCRRRRQAQALIGNRRPPRQRLNWTFGNYGDSVCRRRVCWCNARYYHTAGRPSRARVKSLVKSTSVSAERFFPASSVWSFLPRSHPAVGRALRGPVISAVRASCTIAGSRPTARRRQTSCYGQTVAAKPIGGEKVLRHYEVMVILDPSLEERTVAPSLDTYLNVIRTSGGSVEKLDVWGRRRLSFEIKKKAEGIYASSTCRPRPRRCRARSAAQAERVRATHQGHPSRRALRTSIALHAPCRTAVAACAGEMCDSRS